MRRRHGFSAKSLFYITFLLPPGSPYRPPPLRGSPRRSKLAAPDAAVGWASVCLRWAGLGFGWLLASAWLSAGSLLRISVGFRLARAGLASGLGFLLDFASGFHLP